VPAAFAIAQRPGVFIDVPEQKPGAVRSLVADDFGPLDEIGTVGNKGSPSSLTIFFNAWKLKQAASPSVPASLPR
jgi:hypothetical protein